MATTDPLAIADRLIPGYRAAFTAAMKALGVVPKALKASLQAALAAGRYGEVEQILQSAAVAGAPQAAAHLGNITKQAVEQGAGAAAIRLGGVFDLTNPAAGAWAKQHVGELIADFTAQQQQTLRALVAASTQGQLTHAQLARALRQQLHLQMNARQAAAFAKFSAGISQQVAALKPTATAARARLLSRIDRYRDTLIRQRARTIAATELGTAVTQGQQVAWKAAQASGRLGPRMVQKWIVTKDDMLCEACKPMALHPPVPLGGLFTSMRLGTTVSGPPLHPNCRCTLGLVTARPTRRLPAGLPRKRGGGPVARRGPVTAQVPLPPSPLRGKTPLPLTKPLPETSLPLKPLPEEPSVLTAEQELERALQIVAERQAARTARRLSQTTGTTTTRSGTPVQIRVDSRMPAEGARDWKLLFGKARPEEVAERALPDLSDLFPGGRWTGEWSYSTFGSGGPTRQMVLEAYLRDASDRVIVRVDRRFDLKSRWTGSPSLETRKSTLATHVDHHYLSVLKEYEGIGISKRILSTQFPLYEKLGVRVVRTHANIDVGGYSWARAGFLPEAGSAGLDTFARHVQQRLGTMMGRLALPPYEKTQVFRQATEALQAFRDGDMKAIWRLADIREHTTMKLPNGKPMTVGQYLLTDSEWTGLLDMTNAEQMARLHHYFGG